MEVRAIAGVDESYSYDLNGNMTSDGTRTFEWDAENRLVAVVITATGHRSEFGYDGMGRRVVIRELDPDSSQNLQVTSEKKYLWAGLEIAQERSADGGTVVRQFYAQGFVDADGTVLFYNRDHLVDPSPRSASRKVRSTVSTPPKWSASPRARPTSRTSSG